MFASGTRKARDIPGLSNGSSRNACEALTSSQSTPVARHPWANLSAYAGSSNGVVTNRPACVLDAVGGDPPQDPVLGDALLGGALILDRVAPARVQQPVEATAGALGEIPAVDEYHIEAAQRRVPGHPGARRPAADHENIGAQRDHLVSLPLPLCGRAGAATQAAPIRPETAQSTQSKVRVTAFFHSL